MLTRRQKAMHWMLDQMASRFESAYRDLEMILSRPTIQDLSLAGPLFKDVASCLRAVVDDVDDRLLLSAATEFHEIDSHLTRHRSERKLIYPANFPVLKQTGLLLYSLVRATRPARVLEAGVADGYSTAIILEAMGRNGVGELHSFDIRDDVGVLVDDREHWHLHVSRRKRPIRDLQRIAERLRPLDVFFHDSDHRFVPQAREYDLADLTVKTGGYLVSDDTDFSYAFMERMRGSANRSALLLDDIKCSGVLRVG